MKVQNVIADRWLPWWELVIGVGLFVVLVGFQYQLWLMPGRGWRELWQVEAEIRHQMLLNAEQTQQNQILWAEIHSLQAGETAIEERGRLTLGFVTQDETFFQIIENSELIPPIDFPPPLPIGPSSR